MLDDAEGVLLSRNLAGPAIDVEDALAVEGGEERERLRVRR